MRDKCIPYTNLDSLPTFPVNLMQLQIAEVNAMNKENLDYYVNQTSCKSPKETTHLNIQS